MALKRSTLLALTISICIAGGLFWVSTAGSAQDAQPTVTKRIGTIKAVNGNSLTLSPTSGSDVSITVQPQARILRLAPGEKDLKNATSLQLQDLHVGDTVRVRGPGSPDGNSISGLEIIVITQAAVAAVSDQMRQDWQKRGVGGRVDSIDTASGTVTLSIPSLTAKKSIVVHTAKDTVVHRYAADSAKPEEAKPSSLAEIQPGDQLRARGNKNADGTEITAEEIYAGVFPQYAGTVKSVDAGSGMLTIQDLASKKNVQIKISPDSQLHKIPPERAQMIAMRLKGILAGATGATRPAQSESKPGAAASAQAPSPGGSNWPGGGGAAGTRSGGPPDLQRILSQMPSTTLADMNLQKGDAVILLTTEGSATTPHTAITLLSGVEPILQASPSAQAMMLTPWNLGGGAPGGEGSQ